MPCLSGFLENPSMNKACTTDQTKDKAVVCTCNDDRNLEWSSLSKSWIDWMEWTELQVLMAVLECVKRHPQILRIFKSLPFQCQQDIIPTDHGAVGVRNERQAWSWKLLVETESINSVGKILMPVEWSLFRLCFQLSLVLSNFI